MFFQDLWNRLLKEASQLRFVPVPFFTWVPFRFTIPFEILNEIWWRPRNLVQNLIERGWLVCFGLWIRRWFSEGRTSAGLIFPPLGYRWSRVNLFSDRSTLGTCYAWVAIYMYCLLQCLYHAGELPFPRSKDTSSSLYIISSMSGDLRRGGFPTDSPFWSFVFGSGCIGISTMQRQISLDLFLHSLYLTFNGNNLEENSSPYENNTHRLIVSSCCR